MSPCTGHGSFPTPTAAVDRTADITPFVNLLLIGTACASALLPTTIALFFFSTGQARRRPVFILNVVIIVLGLMLGVVNWRVQMQSLLGQDVLPGLSILFAVLTILIPALADDVLLMRVLTVYPLVRGVRPAYLATVYGPIVMVKVARLIIDIIFIVDWSRAVLGRGDDPFQASQNAWTTPFPKIAWFLQLFDSTYASGLFLLKIYRETMNRCCLRPGAQISSVGTASSFYYRVRTFFWISASNFVFPVILNLAQLVLAFRDPDFLKGAYVLMLNNYVSIIGVLFATIWSAGTKGISSSPHKETREAELGGALPESPRFASASDVELARVDRPESLPGTIIADARRPSAGSSFGLGLATPCRDGCGAPVGIAL